MVSAPFLLLLFSATKLCVACAFAYGRHVTLFYSLPALNVISPGHAMPFSLGCQFVFERRAEYTIAQNTQEMESEWNA